MKIWLIAFYFPPINTIGVERPKKFLRYFLKKGFDTTIFSVCRQGEDNVDIPDDYRCRRSKVCFAGYHFRDTAVGRWSRWWRLVLPRAVTAVFDDSGWTWMPHLRRDMELAWQENNRPDVIVATGRPFLTFLTITRFANKYGIPVILDYRDAWSGNPHSSYNMRLRQLLISWLERRVNRQAFGILTVSRFTAKSLKSETKPLVIYNLPDRAYVDEIKAIALTAGDPPPDKLVLVFAGTLYPGRDFDPICLALATLPLDVLSDIEIQYCGDSSARARASFQAHNVAQNLVLHGTVSKSESVRMVASADIAISIICSSTVNNSTAIRGVITTKVFDYVAMGKEILNIIPDGFEFSDFAREIGLQGLINHRPDDVEGIAAFLRSRVEHKRAFRRTISNDISIKWENLWDAQMEALDELLVEAAHENVERAF
ncbi:glycosyltransferase [Ancylobacter polymorphus]|uniref:Glycosyltransferase involved in cell wall biosynthesis n=1 Tax=Ancylobacter polymorphus TaxID=223390 RepID=A0ABU0BFQ7_9HYPH|nr:glycosyltransferase [Ancylobacter polymorphus]MDQ0304641.1 glycosyltransferase involved in cell wall biosynthesis [Ancylobacter polymorphus]